MNSFSSIKDALSQRILVMDGAMGTMIQRYKLQEKDYQGVNFKNHSKNLFGCNDLLCITQPQIIKEIHRQYLDAGADLIETNSFNANSISMEDYDLVDKVYKLNVSAAKIAKELTTEYTKKNPKKPRWVIGVLGPTNRTASLSSDINNPSFRNITYEELVATYTEQIKGLIDGGVDILMIETVFDTLNAKAALFAVSQFLEKNHLTLPVMVSGTITDSSGRTLSGQVTEAFLISMSHFPLLSIGLNCALGADQLKPYLSILSEKSSFFVSAHPNAGLPNQFGEYDESPEIMIDKIKDYFDDKVVNIIGGCCGTTPDHIKKITQTAQNYRPRNKK